MINKHRVKPSMMTFNLLLAHASSTKQLHAVHSKLKYLRIKPNIEYYTMLISRFLKYKDSASAMKHLSEMLNQERLEPNAVFYGSLLNSLARLNLLELFENGLESMLRSRIRPDQYILTVFLIDNIADSCRFIHEIWPSG